MNINFTKQEYRTLIDLLEIADWIIHGDVETGIPKETKHYHDLVQRVYSHAKEMGVEDLIEHSEETSEYYPTAKFEEEANVHPLIDAFTEHAFWRELISRLAQRDAVREVGEKKYSKMDWEERIYLIHGYEEKWETEFTANGLEKISCIELH